MDLLSAGGLLRFGKRTSVALVAVLAQASASCSDNDMATQPDCGDLLSWPGGTDWAVDDPEITATDILWEFFFVVSER